MARSTTGRFFTRLMLLGIAAGASLVSPTSATPIEGRVLDVHDRPAPGARVRLMPQLPDRTDAALLAAGEVLPPPLFETTTDESGRFQLDVGLDLFEVWVDAPGATPVHHVLPPVLQKTILPTCRLTPGDTVEVEVLDPEGAPVSGALVRATDRISPRGPWRPRPARGFSDLRGRARLAVAADSSLVVAAVAPGFAETVDRDLSPGRWSLRLQQARPHELVVESAEGDLLPNVLVRSRHAGFPFGVTDSKGRVTIPRSMNRFAVDLLDRDDFRWVTRIESAEAVSHILRPTTVVVRGTLEDALTKRRLANAILSMGSGSAVRSDGNGAFVLPPSEDGGTLRIFAEGYLHTTFEVGVLGRQRFQIESLGPVLGGALGFLQLSISPTSVLSATILDAAGRPLPGTSVRIDRVSPKSAAGHPVRLQTTSDAAGRALLQPLAATARYRVEIRHAEQAPLLSLLEAPVPEGPSNRVFRLQPGSRITGRLLEADGSPIDGAVLSLHPPAADPLSSLFDEAGVRASSDRDGSFELAHVPPGRWTLRANHADFMALDTPHFEARGTAPLDLGDLVLAPRALVAGLVLDPDGRPLGEVEITIGPPGSDMAAARVRSRTGSDGRFTLLDLPEGQRFDLVATPSDEGLVPLRRHDVVASSEDALVLELPRPVAIRGRLESPQGQLAQGAWVTATSRSTTARSDAEFALEGLEPGIVELEARAQDLAPSRRTLDLSPGTSIDNMVLVLDPGATLVGRLLSEDGQALSDLVILATGRQAQSDDEGRFTLKGLRPGEVRLRFLDPMEGKLADRHLVLPPGRTETEIVLPVRHTSIRGHVIDARGRPVGEAEVGLRPLRAGVGGGLGSRTRINGEFEVTAWTLGPHALTGSSPSRGNAWRRVRLEGGSLEGVVLELLPGGVLAGRILGARPEQIAAASIVAEPVLRPGQRRRHATIDLEGHWRIEDVPEGRWDLRADFGTQSQEHRVQLTEASPHATHDFDLSRGRTVWGTATAEGFPVHGARVGVWDRSRGRWITTVRTESDGTFAIEGLDDGELSLHATAPGRQSWIRDLAQGQGEIVIELLPTGLAGHVVDPDTGLGIPDASLRVTTQGAGSLPPHLLSRSSRTDTKGAFTFEHPPMGTFRVIASAEGRPPQELTLALQPGQVRDDVRIELPIGPSTSLQIQGVLPPGVRILAAGMGREAVTLPVAADGFVRTHQFPEGEHLLQVESPGLTTSTVRVSSPSASPATVTFEHASRLLIEVPELTENGRAPTGFHDLVVTDTEGRIHAPLSEPRNLALGSTLVDDLPAGQWTVLVTLEPNGTLWGGSARTEVGRTTVLRLEAEPSGP